MRQKPVDFINVFQVYPNMFRQTVAIFRGLDAYKRSPSSTTRLISRKEPPVAIEEEDGFAPGRCGHLKREKNILFLLRIKPHFSVVRHLVTIMTELSRLSTEYSNRVSKLLARIWSNGL
jgi:hypothetical protein